MKCVHCGNLNPPDRTHCYRCSRPLAHLSEPPPPPRVAVGEHVASRFRVERMLGEGGQGQVFEAFDQRLERRVALKVLSSASLVSLKVRERFEREAKVLARVRHPNVIEVFDFFEHHGDLVLGIEFVEGGTLADRIGAEGMPPAEVVRVAKGVLEGLSAIHAEGLVHRDIKPTNVLLTKKGVPKIADLGIAHDSTGRSLTRTGSKLGTPEYMSPEQIRGDKIDARTDLYAVGILLYEAVTGAVPFRGNSEYEVQDKHVREPPDEAALRARAPSSLVRVILRALAKSPAERWASAEEMAAALEGGLGLEASTLERAPVSEHRPPVDVPLELSIPSASTDGAGITKPPKFGVSEGGSEASGPSPAPQDGEQPGGPPDASISSAAASSMVAQEGRQRTPITPETRLLPSSSPPPSALASHESTDPRRGGRWTPARLGVLVLSGIAVFVGFAHTGECLSGTSVSTPGESTSAPKSGMAEAGNDSIADAAPGRRVARAGDRVSVHYVGTLVDGTEFDSSRKRGDPFTFVLGGGQVIKGWEKAIPGLGVGDRRRLVIPPEDAYGTRTMGRIPANSTLQFDIEIMDIK